MKEFVLILAIVAAIVFVGTREAHPEPASPWKLIATLPAETYVLDMSQTALSRGPYPVEARWCFLVIVQARYVGPVPSLSCGR